MKSRSIKNITSKDYTFVLMALNNVIYNGSFILELLIFQWLIISNTYIVYKLAFTSYTQIVILHFMIWG
jgi:hypothetical protein